MNYKVSHPTKKIFCEIDLPASKSISNRLLIISALCLNKFKIQNLSDSQDTTSLKNAIDSNNRTLDVGAAGTSFRFLTAFLSTLDGLEYILTGSDRMKERPIKELVDSLRKLGAQIEYLGKEDFPPLKITGKNLTGGKIKIDGSISSQFISALLLIAPNLKNGIELEIVGDIVSKPYINMTLSLMKYYGVDHVWEGNTIYVKSQKYIAKDYKVESDWSSASFWYQIASLSEDCNIKIRGLDKRSIQGDIRLIKLFNKLGVNSEFIFNTLILTKNKNFNVPKLIDLIDTPDLYQPLRCTIFGLRKSSKFIGLFTLKDKETDRVRSVNKELKKIKSSKIINTYQDHRMAMCFAPLCIVFGELQINNVEVVNKSYQKFWEDLELAGFKITPLTPINY